jgi:hypothetical protein
MELLDATPQTPQTRVPGIISIHNQELKKNNPFWRRLHFKFNLLFIDFAFCFPNL